VYKSYNVGNSIATRLLLYDGLTPYRSDKRIEDDVVRVGNWTQYTYHKRFPNLIVYNKLCAKLQALKREIKFDGYNWFVGKRELNIICQTSIAKNIIGRICIAKKCLMCNTYTDKVNPWKIIFIMLIILIIMYRKKIYGFRLAIWLCALKLYMLWLVYLFRTNVSCRCCILFLSV